MKLLLAFFIALLVLVGAVWILRGSDAPQLQPPPSQQTTSVTSFEECVKVGGNIMESYPRQCAIGKKTFTEVLSQRPGEAKEPVVVDGIVPNVKVSSPLFLNGKALGTWFFEASFPVEVIDEVGRVLGRGIATAQGEWMTENYVPFSAEVKFNAGSATGGYIVFKKDNPSGLAEHDASIRIPVKF